MVLTSRLIAALAYAGAAFLFGVSLGERGELGVVQHLFAAVIPVATLVLAFLSKKEGRIYVIATGAAMFIGLTSGQRSFDTAWRECIANGERVRTALVARNGDYPARLEELAIPLPCRCTFRRTILHYLSNDRGFRLWMSDDREVYSGTDRRPFRRH